MLTGTERLTPQDGAEEGARVASNISRAQSWARYPLGAIRLFNGAASLFVPRQLGKRLGVDPDTSPAAVYVLRLFGVRTIYVGLELLIGRGEHLRHALRVAPAVHLSDTLAAYAAGKAGELPAKSARMATVISSVNFVLAILAATSREAKGKRSAFPW